MAVTNLVGCRVRCASSDIIYRVVLQAGEEVIGIDESTGEYTVLPFHKIVRHSSFLVFLGALIQIFVFGYYAPLGDLANYIRSAFFGFSCSLIFAWLCECSASAMLTAGIFGAVLGLAIGALINRIKRKSWR